MMELPQINPEPPRRFGNYLRTGYCCRCGECCKGNPYTGNPDEMCPHYAEENGVGNCTDRHGHYYLSGCINWPYEPEHIADKPKCTYKFEAVA